MAPLPPNNTGRVFVDYSVAGEQHTLLGRYPTGGDAITVMDVLDSFLTAIGTAIYEYTILGARESVAGSDISLPITWSGSDHYGSDDGDHANTAWYLTYVGRSSGGRRVRLFLFGSKNFEDNIEHDYRLPTTSLFGDARDVLVGASSDLVAIDELSPTWYNYVNVGVNAYWRNKIR